MTQRRLEFWFDFASTYAYLTAMRIEDECAAQGVDLRWRPFLLGPLFKEQGWNNSPFVLYPAKGAYMWRDIERRAAHYGLAFKRPPHFPQNSVHAARIALAAQHTHLYAGFIRAVFQAEFTRDVDISDRDAVVKIALNAGLGENIIERAASPVVKAELRSNVDQARALMIFGAPSFVVDGELFWGDDRLEDALRHAAKRKPPPAA